MKRPSFQFYPGDWLHDAALRSCSVAARGLWMDMLCYMHQSERYGYLVVGDQIVGKSALSRMTGVPTKALTSLLNELFKSGVLNQNGEGIYYSKRMIRDEEIRLKRAAGGVKGGNPKLTQGYPEGLPKVGSKVNLPPNLQPTPSSSSSIDLSNDLDHGAPDPHEKFSSDAGVCVKYIASLDLPNLMNFSDLQRWIASKFYTTLQERKDLNPILLISLWQETCNYCKENGKANLPYIKTVFSNKIKEYREPDTSARASTSQPTQKPEERMIQRILAAPKVRNRWTGEIIETASELVYDERMPYSLTRKGHGIIDLGEWEPAE